MKLAIAVHLDGSQAQVAAAAFDAWDALEPTKTYLSHIPPRQNSCRPDKSKTGGGDEGREWLGTDKHSRTRL